MREYILSTVCTKDGILRLQIQMFFLQKEYFYNHAKNALALLKNELFQVR